MSVDYCHTSGPRRMLAPTKKSCHSSSDKVFMFLGWMADFGEYTPMYAKTGFDGRWWNEEYNEILHAKIPQDWASLNR